MTTTKDKLEFTFLMARHTRATLRQCQALMRYAGTLRRIAEDECNVAVDEAGQAARNRKRENIQCKIWFICDEMREPECPGCKAKRDAMGALAHGRGCQYGIHGIVLQPTPVFSGDPRGAVLKIRTADGFTNDMGREGIRVPS